ncbi:LPXTG cell wall anchor domain-containing protein, partial [Lactobacillus amylovorus]|uniref:LPXTG cell wall anchor domain-containing protein n=1 Tax=Lactobacillus amylovorus TaxID=1604 RepID=UPI00232EB2E5
EPINPGNPDEPINPGKGSAVYPDGTDKAVKKNVPAQTPKAPAEKLVKTPVKAPKAVKEAAPAEMPAQKAAQAQDQLPQTGEDNSKAAFGLGLASILGGIGILGAFKRKKKEN